MGGTTSARCLLPFLVLAAFGCGGGRLGSAGGGASVSASVGSGGEAVASEHRPGRSEVVERLLRDAEQLIGKGGAVPRVERAWSGVVVDGQVLALELPVEPHRCLGVIVLGSRGIRDADVRLYAPDGSVLAVDEEPDARAVVGTCGLSPGTAPLYARVHVFRGVGTLLVVPFVFSPDRMEPLAHVMGMGPGLVAGRETERFDALREALRQRGYEARGGARGVEVTAGLQTRLPVSMRAGRCYVAVVVSERGVRGLEADVLDAWGQPLARGEPDGDLIAVQWCVEGDLRGALRLRLARGKGRFFVHLFASAAAMSRGREEAWIGLRSGEVASGLEPDALRERFEQLRAVWSDGTWRLLSVRRMRSWEAWRPASGPSVEASPERCTLWVALGGGGLTRLRWRGGGPRASVPAWKGEPARAYLWRCPGRGEDEVPILVTEGSGGEVLLAHWSAPPTTSEQRLVQMLRRHVLLLGGRRSEGEAVLLQGEEAEAGVRRVGCFHGGGWSRSGHTVRLEVRRGDGSLAAVARGRFPVLRACGLEPARPVTWRLFPEEGTRGETLRLWVGGEAPSRSLERRTGGSERTTSSFGGAEVAVSRPRFLSGN